MCILVPDDVSQRAVAGGEHPPRDINVALTVSDHLSNSEVSMDENEFDHTWIAAFAASNNTAALNSEQVDALLDLAGRAAHQSGERRNAPLSCFLAGLQLGQAGSAPTAEAISAF
jgi:hypothetical protein